MKKFVKSYPLEVGGVPQRDLIDNLFQQFLLINQRKIDKLGKLSQSGLKVTLLRLGNFHTYIRKKNVMRSLMTSLFVFISSSENRMYFREKNIFSSKYFYLGCVFISNTGDDREQKAPCNSLNLVLRRKLRHDFIFGIP